ncbi:hypothetical protein ACLOJK_027081, partial [Asimina triloba]
MGRLARTLYLLLIASSLISHGSSGTSGSRGLLKDGLGLLTAVFLGGILNQEGVFIELVWFKQFD